MVGQQPHRPTLLRSGRVGAHLEGAFHDWAFAGRVVSSATRPSRVGRRYFGHRISRNLMRWTAPAVRPYSRRNVIP
jgi:hypothetical protein